MNLFYNTSKWQLAHALLSRGLVPIKLDLSGEGFLRVHVYSVDRLDTTGTRFLVRGREERDQGPGSSLKPDPPERHFHVKTGEE